MVKLRTPSDRGGNIKSLEKGARDDLNKIILRHRHEVDLFEGPLFHRSPNPLGTNATEALWLAIMEEPTQSNLFPGILTSMDTLTSRSRNCIAIATDKLRRFGMQILAFSDQSFLVLLDADRGLPIEAYLTDQSRNARPGLEGLRGKVFALTYPLSLKKVHNLKGTSKVKMRSSFATPRNSFDERGLRLEMPDGETCFLLTGNPEYAGPEVGAYIQQLEKDLGLVVSLMSGMKPYRLVDPEEHEKFCHTGNDTGLEIGPQSAAFLRRDSIGPHDNHLPWITSSHDEHLVLEKALDLALGVAVSTVESKMGSISGWSGGYVEIASADPISGAAGCFSLGYHGMDVILSGKNLPDDAASMLLKEVSELMSPFLRYMHCEGFIYTLNSGRAGMYVPWQVARSYLPNKCLSAHDAMAARAELNRILLEKFETSRRLPPTLEQ